jgi:arginine decarboxylase
MKTLYDKLKTYRDSDYYGFHMPGHKRLLGNFENPFSTDITEIEGFDDLHHPQTGGVLTKAQEQAAAVYGSQETHFLVNGSTGGILSAILGCTCPGGSILVSRNCHRSVYHGIALHNLRAVYVYPQQDTKLWINGSILPEDVENALENFPDIQAVLITSPTYDGICSDLEEIGRIVHRKKIPLLVDQAHGAHFPFHPYFPRDAVSQGADVVIHSVHKTLPSLTQTALLHINGSLADRERIRKYLSVFQTSSPSYVLMASLDSCMDFLETRGKDAFERQTALLRQFHGECKKLKKLRVMDEGIRDGRQVWDVDLSKLLCSVRETCWTGMQLGELLRRDYHLEMEMNTCTYSLGISSVADTKEGFHRLQTALFELDERAQEKAWEHEEEREGAIQESLPRLKAAVSIGEAEFCQKEWISVEEAVGRIAASFIYVYPPGIPLAAPGERITEEVGMRISLWKLYGLEVQGLEANGKIGVLKDR